MSFANNPDAWLRIPTSQYSPGSVGQDDDRARKVLQAVIRCDKYPRKTDLTAKHLGSKKDPWRKV
jgi:hypothetical protein